MIQRKLFKSRFFDVLFYDEIYIIMGRKKLNRTKDELLEQQRNRAKRYYQRHKQRLNEKSMQKYWENKRDLQNSK